MPSIVELEPYVSSGGPWVFLGIGIIAILSGRLVPSRTMDDRMKDKNEQITLLLHAFEISEESRKIGEQQVEKLLDQGRTTNFLLANIGKQTNGGGTP